MSPDRTPLTNKELLETFSTLEADLADNLLWLIDYRERIGKGIYAEELSKTGEVRSVLKVFPALELAATKEMTRMVERLRDKVAKEEAGAVGSVQVSIDITALEEEIEPDGTDLSDPEPEPPRPSPPLGPEDAGPIR